MARTTSGEDAEAAESFRLCDTDSMGDIDAFERLKGVFSLSCALVESGVL